MAGRLAWWMVPAGMVVLARVLTVAGPNRGSDERAARGGDRALAVAMVGDRVEPHAGDGSQPLPAAAGFEGESVPVVLQDAAGHRTQPRALPSSPALVLQLPAAAAGQRVGFRLERYVERGADPVLWLEGRPNIGSGAQMRISGLPDGRYAIAVTYLGGAEEHTVACREFDVPGRVELLR
ncbi:MAG: hypothetical protein NXI31_03665 [bacterium]|nr:hypothetical protein [bacterium]